MLNKRHLALDDELQTSLRWLAKSDGTMSKITRKLCVSLKIMGPHERFDSNSTKTKAVFVGTQFLYTVITILPCKVSGQPVRQTDEQPWTFLSP